ncbi:MAG TPA: nitrate reductase [Rubrobacteraceae bacterium]|nr:nitrate reductase [Rubrobacteraceae bacterium]
MANTKAAKQPGRWVKSTCPYCGVGCGVEAGLENGRMVQIRGDKSHPANFGKLCPKPTGLPEALSSPDRLIYPQRRTASGDLKRVSWDEALAEISWKLEGTIEQHGPEAAAFYISGQLLTEDYYAVNKLAKGFLGVNNVDSNSRLCMSSAVAAYTGAFGTDGPPSAYADIAFAECVLLWGSNTADCHPITFGRIKRRKKDPAVSVIVIDPRRTATAEIADLHLPIKPGTDLALANAMLCVLIEEGFVDRDFVERRTSGFEATAETAYEWTPRKAARVCGVAAEDIVRAARMFGEAKAALSMWTMGVNQSTVGTLKNRAIINLHLATGNIGKPGAGPFSLTGQPNAMGGREVGGLAHLLPGYRLIANEEHRREVEEAWGVEPGSISEKPGLPATEIFRALEDGRAKFLWIAATNPAASMPDLARTRRALENAEFVVVQDAYPTETTAYADLILPVAQWGEKTGTMTNTERRVSIVEKVVEPPGEARPDWEIFAATARKMGFEDDFAWQNSAEVYEEYKELTRDTVVDVTGLSHARLRRGPVQWPVPETLPFLELPARPMMERTRDINGEHPGTPRLYANKKFNTPDSRARFEPTPHQELHEPPTESYPLTLSNGRIKNQWHTMTRTGRSEKLMRDLDGPFVEVHPEAAGDAGIKDGESARISSARGSFVARVVVTEDIEASTVFAPFHWGDLWTDGGSLNNTTHDAADPISKQPELKGAAVRLEPASRYESADVATRNGANA